jgi:hypothetical protein
MPNTTPPKCKIPLQSPGLWSLQPLKSPTRFYEDPLFLVELLENGFREGFPLYIREVERIAQVLAGVGGTAARNEQVEAWDAVVIAADGSVSTFSPEFMEVRAPDYGNFVLSLLDPSCGRCLA